MSDKLIPYSVYLPSEYYDKIRELAKERKASGLIRDAICMILDGDDEFKSGYNKCVRDAIKVIKDNKDIKHISVKNGPVSDILVKQILELYK
jgi:hypothetical protein